MNAAGKGKNFVKKALKKWDDYSVSRKKKGLPVHALVTGISEEYLSCAAEGKVYAPFGGPGKKYPEFADTLVGFFDKFDSSQVERTVRLTGDLLLKLYDEGYIFSISQLKDVVAFLDIIEFTQNTSETYDTAKELLKSAVALQRKSPDRTKAMCLKYIFPAVYDLNKENPVLPKFCFIQPRKGLNQSFRYFYRRLKRNFPWELKLYKLYRSSLSLEEYYTHAAWAIRDMASASAVFFHESSELIGHLAMRPETLVIQLWHGCGVFKHLGLSAAGMEGYKTLKEYQEYPEYNNYSLVTIASPELSWVFEEFMGIPKDSGIIRPLGVARTDEFFSPDYKEKCYQKLYEAIPEARDKKVILYAPTYRGKDPHRVSPDALDIPLLGEKLKDRYILIMKHHQTAVDVPQIPQPYRDTFAWDMTRGRGMNINELMTVSDICITDYSSVAFEFSIFDRPIIFYVFDIDEYIDKRGLYYDFKETAPGPLCRTTEEIADYILGTEQGFDDREILAFRDRFMCSCDGHSCERIISFLVERLLPVPEEFTKTKNPKKEGFEFLGWKVYRLEDGQKIWLMDDGSFKSREEKTKGHVKLLTTKEELSEASNLPFPVFYNPSWKGKTEP